MTNPSPHNIQLRAWIRDFILNGGEFTQELEDQIIAVLGTVLTTRGDLLTRDGTGAVRLAKGAQNTLLNMGANDPAWATLSTILDNVIGSTRGALLMRGASGWSKIDPGTSGNVLTSNGAGADPSYQDKASALKFLSSQTASNSSSLDFTSGIDSTYPNYLFVYEDILPASSTLLKVRVSTDAGSSWESTNYVAIVSTDTTAIVMTSANMDTASGGGACGQLTICNPSSGSNYKRIYGVGSYMAATSVYAATSTGGMWHGATTAINGVRFLMHSGNIASGTIRLYGIKGS